MDIYSDIKNKLQKICQPQGLRLYFAEIVSIQDDTTCTVKLEDDLQLSDVRLRSVVNSEESGIVITPAVGSVVLVADLSGGKIPPADMREETGLRDRVRRQKNQYPRR